MSPREFSAHLRHRAHYVVAVTNGVSLRPDLGFQSVSHHRALAHQRKREREGYAVKLTVVFR